MRYGIYAMRDAKVGFLQLMLEQSDEVAMRNFGFAMKRPDTIYQEYAQDFDLYRLGYFDTETGAFELAALPQPLISGPMAAQR